MVGVAPASKMGMTFAVPAAPTVAGLIPSAPDTAFKRSWQLVAGAARRSVDLRFQPGSLAGDVDSVNDLDRLMASLKTQQVNRVG